jgi:hypothetical protein
MASLSATPCLVDFTRKTLPDAPTIHGFIAGVAQEVFPEMATQLGANLLGVSKESLIPILIKAFKTSRRRGTNSVWSKKSKSHRSSSLVG